jgi:hypothetical protein
MDSIKDLQFKIEQNSILLQKTEKNQQLCKEFIANSLKQIANQNKKLKEANSLEDKEEINNSIIDLNKDLSIFEKNANDLVKTKILYKNLVDRCRMQLQIKTVEEQILKIRNNMFSNYTIKQSPFADRS